MSHFQQHKEFFNKPIRLSEDEEKNPILAIEEFFETYNLSEVRHVNQQMDHACLSNDSPPYDDPDERAALLLYRENEERVMEAAYLLFQRNLLVQGKLQQDPGSAHTMK